MRLLPILAAAISMLLPMPAAVIAQSLSNNAGPAELPPAGFTGRNFVDSRGCIFIRAGGASRVIWVPRVTRDAKLVCGFRPTFAQSSPQAVPQPVAQAPAVSAPTVQTVRAPAPKLAAKPKLNNTVPKGYISAWTDGRLNPNRGPRTAEGDAQMAAIWTNKVPMKMRSTVADTAQNPVIAVATASSRGKTKSIANTAGALTKKFFRSSKSPAAGGRFIQIGTYGDPNNAARAIARVQRLGLPAVGQASTLNGQAVQVVLAGPVAPDLALQARQALRNAGYSDAFIR